MASVLISSLLKAATDWLSLIRSTPTTSSTTTTAAAVVDDLEKLERLLPRIKAVLLDAEERQIVDQYVKLWLKEIKDVAYDAEDVLDEYQYHVLRAQVENRDIATSEASLKMKRFEGEEEVMPSASSDSNIALSKISVLNSMADKIKRIRKRFKEISKDRDLLQLKPEDGERRRGSSSEYHPPPTSHMIVKQEICGRDDDKGMLIDWLFSNMDSKFEVLAVVGKGGLGKTTLAQLVYNDQKVSDHFKTRIWICVSEDFDVTRLTKAMIESIPKQTYKFSNQLSPLQESLHKELQGKKVLLVLDDVWNENRALWESLSIPLRGAEMIRIIVTTRTVPVAEIMQTTEKPYLLGHLPEDQCWELFLRHAFCGRDQEKFPSLVEIGKKIVEKCDGLPLAVKSLGGLLSYETDKDEWENVLQSQLWELKTEILPALNLSYIRMPSHLKPCFEICSMFPKDYEFGKDELVKLWAAHGYIQHNPDKDAVEEKGYKYFNELHRRSFFDVFLERFEETIYKMHDNIHDLAHYVEVGMDLSNHSKHKIRHLFFTKKETLEFKLDDIGALRTLKVWEKYIETICDITWLCRNITRLTHLRYFRIIFSSDIEFLLLDGLSNLICLRHLELSTDSNMKLPKSIGDLYNLVVLKITCHELVAVPETLRNLVSLTTIHFSNFKNDKLPALGQLPSLRSLIIYEFENVKIIGNEFCRGQNNRHAVAFPSLTSLLFEHMRKWEKWDELQEGDFPRLQKLEINYCGRLSSLPSLGNLSLLSHIRLLDCELLQLASFPPNLKNLENFRYREVSLSQGLVELKKLERLRGKFGVKINEVFRILKNSVCLKSLILSNIRPTHSAWNDEACLKEYNGIDNLALDFYYPSEGSVLKRDETLHLVLKRDDDDGTMEDENDDQFKLLCNDGTEEDDDDENEEGDDDFLMLEKLQPHTQLKALHITNYFRVGFPSWICHPSFKLCELHLRRCKIEQLPPLGQLPSLKHLHLCYIDRLKTISRELCQGINNNTSHDVVAFPSLIKLEIEVMPCLEEWDGVRQGDFPNLEFLSIGDCPRLSSLPVLRNLSANLDLSLDNCPMINISVEECFPPNLKSLRCRKFETRVRLSPRAQLLKLESIRGIFRVRNNELFEILNNLTVNSVELTIIALGNVHTAMEAEANLKSQHQLESLTLKWNDVDIDYYYEYNSLWLVVEDDDDDGTNQIENGGFFVLEKLQPHISLHRLKIEDYDGAGYPSWIGHPSFERLTLIHLRNCITDQLPTLGQLPSLEILLLESIWGLKKIGDEFCRRMRMNNDRHNVSMAFPSLIVLNFRNMNDWEEWHGVLNGDFPRLRSIVIINCPSLRKNVNSFPSRFLKHMINTQI